MKKYTVLRNALMPDEQEWFQQFYKDHVVTRDLMEVSDRDPINGNSGCFGRYIIVKGSWTPHGCFRECDGYYIRANYSSYDKLITFPGTTLITNVIADVDDR